MKQSPSHQKIPRPPCRRLRVYAFDPSLSRQFDTAPINEVTLKLPWEDTIGIGPVDDYLEVVDYDPASQAFYAPVDLNDPFLLAQDGLTPSDSNPQFHQQMVYAVARTTIRHFERALGRKILWAPRLYREAGRLVDEPVQRLRIYPHALRQANAYYSPEKKALLFGYFPASFTSPGVALPGEAIFTCLGQEIIAHETTHAILDGLHQRFIEPCNEDVWALHEAFADIVALFQHFTYPDVLHHQIARTRGDLEKQTLLSELAVQFGQATGQYGALRNAIGRIDPQTKAWVPRPADPEEILHTTEPHARGAILVAAVFDAFLRIYRSRIADLQRIASGGTGVLPPGDLHPDLVNRLSDEAAKAARHVLTMCIRAMDYMPGVDANFGDFLRAIITADIDLVLEDNHNYRLAFLEAFQARGICPRDVQNMSVESLLWHVPDEDEQRAFKDVFSGPARLNKLVPDWEITTDRRAIYENAQRSQAMLHGWLHQESARAAVRAAKLVLDPDTPGAFFRDRDGIPKLEVHSVRAARRIGPDDRMVTDLVIEMTQRRRGYFDDQEQKDADQGKGEAAKKEDFIFRGSCTLLVDPDSADVRYCIYKRILSTNRLERMRRYLLDDDSPSLRATYFGDPRRDYFRSLGQRDQDPEGSLRMEPFALLHQALDSEEVL